MRLPAYLSPRAEIRVGGALLAAEVSRDLLRIRVDSSLDLADMFTLTLSDPASRWTDSPLFDLGQLVEVRLGYGNDLQPVLLGEIAALQPSFPSDGAPTLTVTGYDRSYRLRHNQPDRPTFQGMTDSAIATRIATDAGLTPVVDPSPFVRRSLPQTQSDMALLKELARDNGFELFVRWDRLYFRAPRSEGETSLLEWGKSLGSFQPRLSSSGLAGIQVIRAYNEELAQAVIGFATTPDATVDTVMEKLGGAALEQVATLGRRVSWERQVESPRDAAAIAVNALREVVEGLFEGSGSCVGLPTVRAGSYVELRGLGRRFSGRYRLRRVVHTLDESGFRTEFEVSQRGESSILQFLRKSVSEAPPPDRQPSFDSVVLARVTQTADPLGLGRVRLTFPWLSDVKESPWARCAMPTASSESGTWFLPQVGDEVVVGFQHGDFTRPIVLGSLWNNGARPPVSGGAVTTQQVIRSRAGHLLRFDDTPGGEQITLQHTSGSSLTLAPDGTVRLHAEKDLELSAKGDVNFHAINVNVNVSGVMNVGE